MIPPGLTIQVEQAYADLRGIEDECPVAEGCKLL